MSVCTACVWALVCTQHCLASSSQAALRRGSNRVGGLVKAVALKPSFFPLSSAYRKHEQGKRRHYDQRVREVEHATFTPLVLSTTGGMGRAATTFYKRLAAMVAEKRDVPYAVTLNWIRCRLSFALLRASIMSI